MRLLLALLFVCGFLTNTALAENLRPGDTIHISVWQDPKLDQTIVIAPDGTIGFPLAGHLKAAGRAPKDVEDELKARLAKNYTGPLDITVSLAAVNKENADEEKPRVYITGEVLRPGPILLQQRINIMQAISLAGGLGPFAARQRIQIHRKINGAESTFVFDYSAYLSGSDVAENISLRPNDIIVVPERGLFE